MQSIFIPGIKLINRLKYPQKFGLIALLLAVFIFIMLSAMLWGINKAIDFTQSELTGVQYIRPLKNLLRNIGDYRALSVLGENTDKKQEQIYDGFVRLEGLNQKYNDVFNLSEQIIIIQDLYNKDPKEYEQINNSLQELINIIWNVSNLVFDPRQEIYYLTDSVFDDSPQLVANLCNIRATGIKLLSAGSITKQERKRLQYYVYRAEDSFGELNNNIKRIFLTKTYPRYPLKKLLQNESIPFEKFIAITNEKFIDSSDLELSPEEFYLLGTSTMNSFSGLYDMQILLLEDLLKQEIFKLKRLRLLIVIPVLLILLALGYIFACFTFSIINAVKYLQDKAMKVAHGDLDIKSELDTHDEMRELSDSINQMITKLKALIAREQIIRSAILSAIEARSPEETTKSIVVNIGKMFNADRCFYIEYDSENDEYSPVEKHNTYISSMAIKDIVGVKLSREEMEPFTDFMFNQKKTLVVKDINKLEIPEKSRVMLEKCKVKSLMGVPVFYDEKPLGIILVEHLHRAVDYSNEDVEILESIAPQTMILLNQAKLKQEILRLNEELKSSLETEKILRKITSEASILKTHEEIDNYASEQLLKNFHTDKLCHFHVEGAYLNWCIKMMRGRPIEKITGKCFAPVELSRELMPTFENIINVSDVEKEIQNEHLKKCLLNEKIKSFIAYPGEQEITMIANEEQKSWTREEKNMFKIIMDTLSFVHLETMQRAELEETRKGFIATLAHDLKSPILSEQKALEFLIKAEGEAKAHYCEEYLKEIYNTNESLLNLIENLLVTYHYESGKVELNKTRENIAELIKNSAESIKFLAQECQCLIFFDIEENLPLADVDKTEIMRVFTNLISNAIRHNAKGTKVEVSAKRFNSSVKFSIKDSGGGISKDVIPKIFQRYPSKKRKVASGLGLYISKQIVEAHNGRIWFETEEGKGTTFHFTLPL